MVNERAPGANGNLKKSTSEMPLSNADGPRGSIGSANAESNLFNKHFNKELKLCEGKFLFANYVF